PTFVRAPNRNAPSREPYRTEAIDRPASKTPPQCRASSAIPKRIAPQIAVTHLAILRPSFDPMAFDPTKSMTVDEARELRAAERLDIAAARIAAITSPAIPVGKYDQTNCG